MNRPEILALYAWAKANPEEHDQTGYARRSPSCGTAYCVAAMACVRAGDRLLWSGSGAQWAHYIEAPLTVGGVNSPRGPAIHTRAAELLGLDEGQADALFDANNDLADLRKWIWAITGTDPEDHMRGVPGDLTPYVYITAGVDPGDDAVGIVSFMGADGGWQTIGTAVDDGVNRG